MRPADLIERKRNGEELPAAEVAELVLAYARDEVPDYQMAAFCMAVYFRGMTPGETFALTQAMIASGDTLDTGAALGRKGVDKHSTGGVGDKTSIAVGPIVAACGVPLGKMSGRGLGHTGGTLDKLEAIPGFRVELTTEEMVAQLRDIGVAIVGQSANLVPADKKLYALRDVTATVDIVPLIASSIMSKKIAAGADAIVLDVKGGDGAFMKTLDEASVLAQEMLELGRRAGKEVTCLLTDMDQPLGRAVGNALEIREALDTVRGEGPDDFTELVLDACARLLAYSDLGIGREEGRRRAEAAVADGSAHDTYGRWIRAQGGDPDPRVLPEAPIRRTVTAPRDGIVARLGALAVGVAALELGAGRRTKEDAIDPAVGVLCFAKRGDTVLAGDDLAEVHARDEASAKGAVDAVLAAYTIAHEVPAARGIVLEVIS
ncbi:MAG: thymidine phosphorylase [Thermoleophilia bacterium]|nr:thymidine phosphorylase [Thermoleophilia bacterium]